MKNLLITIFLLCSLSVMSQPAERIIQVQVAPEHSDWLYKEGENIKFNITVLKNNIPLKDIEVRYDISEDMMKPHLSEKIVLKNGTTVINAGAMKKAGFLRCQAYVKYDGKDYRGVSTAGISPTKIVPTTTLPDDFSQFWENAKAEAAKIPMDIKMTLVPEKCTEKVNVYQVSVQNYRNYSRLYGMLCIPKGGEKYPAVLKLPGAGIRAYNGDMETANKGYIVFEIGIHGIPVDMSGDIYRNLYEGPLKYYHSFNLDNRDEYYYKRVYLGCVRAIDFIYTLPEFDGKNLIAYGGSQGGALSIVTAGLDNRVKALVSFYPALCDITGYAHGRAGGWPHMFNRKENQTADKMKTAQYYDVVNFARQVKVPGFYSFGYNDMICPPTTMFSAVNVVNAPKEILIEENTAHYAYPEQRLKSWEWVGDFLKREKHNY